MNKLMTSKKSENGEIYAIMGLDTEKRLMDRIRSVGGAGQTIVYTATEAKKGITNAVEIYEGMRIHGTRMISDAIIDTGGTTVDHAFLVRPNCINMYVNESNDFRVTKIVNQEEVGGQLMGHRGRMIHEMQWFLDDLPANGCVEQVL
jgi:hypothetical protein